MDVRTDLDRIAHLAPGADHVSPRVERSGPARVSASAFAVDRALAASAAYAVASADGAGEQRGIEAPVRSLGLEHLLAFCTTHVEIDGEPVPAWAELSGIYATADDRQLQIHCNFAHHAAGVVAALGCEPTRESVAAAIGECDALDLEAELIDRSMIAAVVRTLEEWNAHPHAVATAGLPLFDVDQIGDALPSNVRSGIDGAEPLTGLRVVDCSRVLAGPVAGQMLAGAGADVMRIGAPDLPSVLIGVIATGFGKRNAFADIATEAGRDALWDLIRDADVWIDGFRPGALAAHGFTAERVAAERPGIVIVEICAFDRVGPWADRRGYDSIVQSTTGVRWAGGEFAVDDTGAEANPGPLGLPVQALDYATGFLAAGVASQLVAHHREVGGSWRARLSLLRTRNWLAGMAEPEPYVPGSIDVPNRLLDSIDSDFGQVRSVRPLTGHWPSAPELLGSSPAIW